MYFLCTPAWISLMTDSQKCPAACVLNGVVTSGQSISFWEVFFSLKKKKTWTNQTKKTNTFFCSSLSYIAFCRLLLKLFRKFGSVYLLSVLPALEKGERQHLFPWLFRSNMNFEKFICTYVGQGEDRVRMLALLAPEERSSVGSQRETGKNLHSM